MHLCSMTLLGHQNIFEELNMNAYAIICKKKAMNKKYKFNLVQIYIEDLDNSTMVMDVINILIVEAG